MTQYVLERSKKEFGKIYKEKYADIYVVSGTVKILSHRTLLSTIQYLEAKVDSSDKVLDLTNDVPERLLENLVNYILHGKVYLDSNNVFDMLQVADKMNFLEVQQTCYTYLTKKVSTENCVKTLMLQPRAQDPGYQKANQAATKYFAKNISEVSRSTHFLHLNWLELNQLMSKKHDNQELLYDACIRWVEFDIENRSTYLRSILKDIVKMSKLSLKFLAEEMHNPTMLNDKGQNMYADIFSAAFALHSRPESEQPLGWKESKKRGPSIDLTAEAPPRSSSKKVKIEPLALNGVVSLNNSTRSKKN